MLMVGVTPRAAPRVAVQRSRGDMNGVSRAGRLAGLTTVRRAYSASDERRMMPFEEYRKLRRRLKFRSRLAGIPAAVVGVTLSSAVNVHFHPQMLEFQNPEVELTPIL